MDRNKSIADEKAGLRAAATARRQLIPEQSRIAMSRAVAGYIAGMPEIVKARMIHLYLSIPGQPEVSTSALVDALASMKKKLSVPVIREGELVSAAFQKGEAVLPARFGQPEPVTFSPVDESQLDVVLMPLLAFDSRGHRIGYGKGFYDRFLHRLSQKGIRPLRIGVAFLIQMVDEVPVDILDEHLDGVVHEQGVIRFN